MQKIIPVFRNKLTNAILRWVINNGLTEHFNADHSHQSRSGEYEDWPIIEKLIEWSIPFLLNPHKAFIACDNEKGGTLFFPNEKAQNLRNVYEVTAE